MLGVVTAISLPSMVMLTISSGIMKNIKWRPHPNHPVRVAERAAVLDILSDDGRMDLGTGRSTTLIEMDGFEIDPEQTRAQWDEAIRMIPKMWTQDPFSHQGKFFNIPPRSVIPKPVQDPVASAALGCPWAAGFVQRGRRDGLGRVVF